MAIYGKNDLLKNDPVPIRQYEAGKTKIFVYNTPQEASFSSAINVSSKQICLVNKKGFTSMMLMAAPSAYNFYRYYIDIAKSLKVLQHAIKNTHYFQMDDYLLPEGHPASFKFLLEKQFFNQLADFTDKSKIHFLNTGNADDDSSDSCLNYYSDMVLEYGPDIHVKGQGEDGHWGFHQPGETFGNLPGILKVNLNIMNKSQQLRDHPGLYYAIDDAPKIAFSGNVSLFMNTRQLIEDIVPQPSKAYAVLASYGNEEIDELCPSGKLKDHENSIARINTESAWALVQYRENGFLSSESVYKLDKIWEDYGDPKDVAFKKDFMRKTFKKLKIKYNDHS